MMELSYSAAATKESESLGLQEVYGDDPTLRLTHDSIRIVHKAKIATLCCDNCDGSRRRKYSWVLENAIEKNIPRGFPYLPCPCDLKPNCCCIGVDNIDKTYFDRGIFDRQSCLFSSGFLAGPGSLHVGPIKRVCCCVTCCDCYNAVTSNNIYCCCGERVLYVPAETCCWCLPTRSCWVFNCFRLNGFEDGEPLLACPLATHLALGEGVKLAESLERARAEYSQKTGKGY